MYGVQKELTTLRAKADDAAIQLAKNEKIRSLESERDWYRSEAVRLDEFTTQLKTDVTYLHERMSALEDDRAWFEKAAKASERKNRILQAKLQGLGPNTVLGNSITVSGNYNNNNGNLTIGTSTLNTTAQGISKSDSVTRNFANLSINQQEMDHELIDSHDNNDDELNDLVYRESYSNSNNDKVPLATSKPGTTKGVSNKSKPANKKLEIGKLSSSSSSVKLDPSHIAAVTAGISGAMNVLANTPVGSGPRAAIALSTGSKPTTSPTKGSDIASLNNQIQELSSINKRLLRRLTELEQERSESENVLLACIQETKKEILRRRTRAGSPPSSPSRASRSSSPTHNNNNSTQLFSVGVLETEITGEHRMHQALQTERSSRVHTEQFTRTDKRALLIQFLQDDRVLDRLIELL